MSHRSFVLASFALLVACARQPDSVPETLVLGIQSDSTIWLDVDSTGVRSRMTAGLVVPRDTGFWEVHWIVAAAWNDRAGTCHVVADRDKSTPRAAREGIVGISVGPGPRVEPRLPENPIMCLPDYLAEGDENTSDELVVTFVSPTHLGVRYTLTDEGESAATRSWQNFSAIASIDGIHRRGLLTADGEQYDPPIDTLILTRVFRQAEDSLRAHAANAADSDYVEHAVTRTRVLMLRHEHGHWWFEPSFVDDCNACYNEYTTEVVNERPPAALVGFDSLTVPWTAIQRRMPRAIDAFTSPRGDVAVIRDSSALHVFRARGGRLRDSIATRPLSAATQQVWLFPRVRCSILSAPTSPPHAAVDRGHQMTRSKPRRSGRILLVDDDRAVRNTTRGILENAGWTVLTARDGEEALELARDIRYKLDLVLTDIVMPVMSGRQLVREMLAERPTLRVLLFSGFDSFAVTEDPDTVTVALLEKPFTTQDLLSAVETAAARRPTQQ